MDPVTAFGVAASACQFVDFAIKIVSKGNKLRKSPSGLLVEHADLYATSLKIIELNNRLVASAQKHSEAVSFRRTDDDKEMERACKAMTGVASDLLVVLDKLRLPTQKGRWRSMRQAVKAMIGKGAVEEMRISLGVHRQRLDTALLTSLWNKMNLLLSVETSKRDSYSLPKAVIHRLFATSQEVSPRWQTEIAQAVLNDSWTPEKKGHIELFSQAISSAATKQETAELQTQIIHRLRFEDFSDREYRIAPAHQSTFHWIFAGPNEQHVRKWCLFREWLQGSEKLYWITGKPGSGKSTLMKFLSRDCRTRQNLLFWSGSLPLVTAHFYFWNSGTHVQMSLEGFYRTVVHAILSKKPGLTSDALPDRWANAKMFGEDMRGWTIQELEQAFNALVGKSGRSYRLCLFIDGLDEYGGDHMSFVEQLRSITQTHDIKLCIASRPWPVFEVAFSSGAHLMLQDLTFPDIVRFTWSKLHNHSRFQSLLALEGDFAGNLILNISDKAQGVFLWVDLVTKSLIEGLTNSDRVSDLYRRLEGLPSGLEELYQKMFDSIEPFYHAHASRYLQIAMVAAGQLSALGFYFADEEDQDHAFKATAAPFTDTQRMVRYAAIRTRLNGCCKSFLEIPKPEPSYHLSRHEDTEKTTVNEVYSPPTDLENGSTRACSTSNVPKDKPNEDELEDGSNDLDSANHYAIVEDAITPEPDRKVTYIHRTAKDFLEHPDMHTRILKMSPPGFNASIVVLNSYLLLLKTLPLDKLDRHNIWSAVMTYLDFASTVETATDVPLTKHLDELDKTVSYLFRVHNLSEQGHHWTTTRRSAEDSSHEDGFLSLAAEFNLKRYIQSKLELGIPVFTSTKGRPLLDYIIEDYRSYPSLIEPTTSSEIVVPRLHVIKTLLDRGEDPNFHYNNSTTWTRVLDQVAIITHSREIEPGQKQVILEHWANIVDIFIRHDADPLVNRNSPVVSRVREIFGPYLPQRARELEKSLRRTRRRWSGLGKFITPLNRKLDKLSLETTPLPVLKRLEAAVIAPPTLSEYARGYGQSGKESRVTPGSNRFRLLERENIGRSTPSSHESSFHNPQPEEPRRLPWDLPVEHLPPRQHQPAFIRDTAAAPQRYAPNHRPRRPRPVSNMQSNPNQVLEPETVKILENLYQSQPRWDHLMIAGIARDLSVPSVKIMDWYMQRSSASEDSSEHAAITEDTLETSIRSPTDQATSSPNVCVSVPEVLLEYLSSEDINQTQREFLGQNGRADADTDGRKRSRP